MIETYLAASAIALLSLSGIILIGRNGRLVGAHRVLMPLSVGIFLAVIFFELIPETLALGGNAGAFMIVGGFLAFYLLSHILRRLHSCPEDEPCDSKAHRPTMILIGDAIHNIADGVVIFTAFLISPAAGIAAAIAVALHEIPQELAEYTILRQSGYSHKRALGYNFLSALSILLGVALAQLFVHLGDTLWVLTGIAAGNLLYIVSADLLPELNDDAHHSHFPTIFITLLAGFLGMVMLLNIAHSHGGHAHNHTIESEHEESHDHAHEEHSRAH